MKICSSFLAGTPRTPWVQREERTRTKPRIPGLNLERGEWGVCKSGAARAGRRACLEAPKPVLKPIGLPIAAQPVWKEALVRRQEAKNSMEPIMGKPQATDLQGGVGSTQKEFLGPH